MANAQTTHTASWWERLTERCYATSTPQLVRDVQHEAGPTYHALLNDLGSPLETDFEREMARQLEAGQPSDFVPAKALMPVMMQRFGLQDAEVAAEPGYNMMRKTCNGCPVVGQCWKAMRAGAEVEECRGFCPNAKAFDSLAEV
ncbi:hypothetical protein [Halomonas lysinitropha]|uniref:Uncharacterized protein n=1 Tax=Halomonas lysinitropha TaxID=2607506 RepID=A0A5K1I253_9GAMM|nr:hypothetical protein [Halomonas lysinitropha]VVZ94177.1 hypothetical protein HALO32_00227 [Halomonas lysinitropha]